jgi:hypothetical protein
VLSVSCTLALLKSGLDAAHPGWTNTGIGIRVGDRVNFHATGRIVWDPNVPRESEVGPDGASWTPKRTTAPTQFLLLNAPIASLIGRIGDEVFPIGSDRVMSAGASGQLLLGINERQCPNCWNDKSGSLKITIKVEKSNSPPTAVIFRAPFSRHCSSYIHSRIASTPEQASCSGLSGFPQAQTNENTGSLGYWGFAWGGFCSHYNLFASNNPAAQQATGESLLGGIFTAPVSGTYRISADIELHGNGTAKAGAGAADLIQALVPEPFGTAIGIAQWRWKSLWIPWWLLSGSGVVSSGLGIRAW